MKIVDVRDNNANHQIFFRISIHIVSIFVLAIVIFLEKKDLRMNVN